MTSIDVGFTASNGLGGRFADRTPTPAIVIALLALAALPLLQPLTLPTEPTALLALALWGAAAFGVVPPVQAVVMRHAADAPGLASSVNMGALNLGNALDALVGGTVPSLGFGYGAISPAGAALAPSGVALAAIGARMPPGKQHPDSRKRR